MPAVTIEHFTDPNCPYAYSAEPIRRRLDWVFGEQLAWQTRMVVLTRTPEEYAKKGLTTAMVRAGFEQLSHDPGMPFETAERSHLPGTITACSMVVAARERVDAATGDRVLRALRIAQMTTMGVLDQPDVIDDAIRSAGLDPAQVRAWAAEADVLAALEADMDASRHPLPPAAALDRRLADWDGGRRYTCPTLVLHRPDGPSAVIPGFNPIEVYEVVFANCGPELSQRARPETMTEVLRWAGEPLATAEVAAVAQITREDARERLVTEGATEHVAGTDAFWTAP